MKRMPSLASIFQITGVETHPKRVSFVDCLMPSGSNSGTIMPKRMAASGEYCSRSAIEPTPSSLCFVPAQIWYAAVAAIAPPPTSHPEMLCPMCVSVTVDSPTPMQTSTMEATTRRLARFPKKTASAASTAAGMAAEQLVAWAR